ncbi:hypothetical protein HDU76_004051, partial [Blyttiomyces sp. JEL0837]
MGPKVGNLADRNNVRRDKRERRSLEFGEFKGVRVFSKVQKDSGVDLKKAAIKHDSNTPSPGNLEIKTPISHNNTLIPPNHQQTQKKKAKSNVFLRTSLIEHFVGMIKPTISTTHINKSRFTTRAKEVPDCMKNNQKDYANLKDDIVKWLKSQRGLTYDEFKTGVGEFVGSWLNSSSGSHLNDRVLWGTLDESWMEGYGEVESDGEWGGPSDVGREVNHGVAVKKEESDAEQTVVEEEQREVVAVVDLVERAKDSNGKVIVTGKEDGTGEAVKETDIAEVMGGNEMEMMKTEEVVAEEPKKQEEVSEDRENEIIVVMPKDQVNIEVCLLPRVLAVIEQAAVTANDQKVRPHEADTMRKAEVQPEAVDAGEVVVNGNDDHNRVIV